MPATIYLSEGTAARRRVYLRLVQSSDGASAATSTQVTAGVARLIANGTDTANSTNNITEISSTNAPGHWYVELTAGELTTLGVGNHKARFKEADTLESIDGDFQIVPDDIWTAGPTTGTIADAVWDEARAGHTTGGTYGEGAASVQGNVTGSVASVTGAVGSVTGAVGSVGSGGITAASIATGAVDADAIAADAANEIADALLDRANAIETGYTLRQAIRIMAAALAGKSSSGGTIYRDMADAKARITATVDGSGNRTAITLDGT